jgi:hypothetical protein
MKRRLILLMAYVALIGAKANAQTAVATAGGEAGTVSYTVGQVFVDVATSDKGSLTAGVQQAYEITIVEVGVADRLVTLEAAVYPNPVTDRLVLRVDDAAAALRYILTDANGRAIATDNIVDAQTGIEMGNLAQGVYFLRVDDGNAAVRTFKVVKK